MAPSLHRPSGGLSVIDVIEKPLLGVVAQALSPLQPCCQGSEERQLSGCAMLSVAIWKRRANAADRAFRQYACR